MKFKIAQDFELKVTFAGARRIPGAGAIGSQMAVTAGRKNYGTLHLPFRVVLACCAVADYGNGDITGEVSDVMAVALYSFERGISK